MSILSESVDIARSILPEAVDKRKSKNKIFHFAFGFKKSKLIAIGQNNPDKTHTKALKLSQKFNTNIKYPYLHAETDLVSRLWGKCRIDNRLRVVVLSLNHNGELRNSKPCQRCRKILTALDVTKLWWSNENGFIIR